MIRFSLFVCLLVPFSLTACDSESGAAESSAASAPAEMVEPTAVEPTTEEEVEDESPSSGPEPLRVAEDGTRIFGAEPTAEMETVALTQVLATPAEFDGQVVKTEGEISAVCERMGCWMELSTDDGQAVRVPMAGHGFFLPRDVSGHRATIEGRVDVSELDEATVEHLESEGATAARARVGIEATSVVVLPQT